MRKILVLCALVCGLAALSATPQAQDPSIRSEDDIRKMIDEIRPAIAACHDNLNAKAPRAQFERGVAACTRLLALSKTKEDKRSRLIERSIHYIHLGQFDDALADLTPLAADVQAGEVREPPTALTILRRQADAYEGKRDLKKAEEAHGFAIGHLADRDAKALALIFRGRFFERQMQRQNADFKSAISVDPKGLSAGTARGHLKRLGVGN